MTIQKPSTIDEYIVNFPPDIQIILQEIRQTIQKSAPDATETIAYGMPTFTLGNKHLIYFAAWKHHIGVYPIYKNGGQLKELLAPYLKEKDSVHLPITEPFPYDVIEQIVHMRLLEEIGQ